jgi:hypothetical protein
VSYVIGHKNNCEQRLKCEIFAMSPAPEERRSATPR